MLGYDNEIIYKKGCDNVVVDALSCQFEDESTLLSFSLTILDWIDEAHNEWFSHPPLSELINNLREDSNSSADYSWKEEILRYKDQVMISMTSTLKTCILDELHSSQIVGHLGFENTYYHACHYFFWTDMKNDILTFVAKCDV